MLIFLQYKKSIYQTLTLVYHANIIFQNIILKILNFYNGNIGK